MIVAVDVDYRDPQAQAAAIWFRGWGADTIDHQATALIPQVAEYVPGEFYRRELPCLLQVLALGPPAGLIIVDGYVTLGPGRPGLGQHLYDALAQPVPVVGVGKTRFLSATEAIPVTRGGSQAPIYVTSVGIEASVAAQGIATMAGEHRLPKMLKAVDILARGW